MKRFKNILYIIDDDTSGEDIVADKVITLARLNDAKVTVVQILEENLLEQLSRAVFHSGEKLISLALQQLIENLQSVITDDKWRNIQVHSEVLHGNGCISVIKKVLRDNIDMVIKRGSAGGGIDQLAMRLIRKCPCPIWVINSGISGKLKRILAAVDVVAESKETKLLNKKIIELAYSLAERENHEVHFLHACHLQSESMLQGARFKLGADEIQLMKDQLKNDGEIKLHELLESADIRVRPDHIHVIEGTTDVVIGNALANLQIEVLILGTIARSGIPGLLIGNTVEKILSQVECTVLAVKPDGFISPVTL